MGVRFHSRALELCIAILTQAVEILEKETNIINININTRKILHFFIASLEFADDVSHAKHYRIVGL